MLIIWLSSKNGSGNLIHSAAALGSQLSAHEKIYVFKNKRTFCDEAAKIRREKAVED